MRAVRDTPFAVYLPKGSTIYWKRPKSLETNRTDQFFRNEFDFDESNSSAEFVKIDVGFPFDSYVCVYGCISTVMCCCMYTGTVTATCKCSELIFETRKKVKPNKCIFGHNCELKLINLRIVYKNKWQIVPHRRCRNG